MHDSLWVGIAQVENQVGRACFDVGPYCLTRSSEIIGVDEELDRALDGARVASNIGAVAIKYAAFILEIFDGATVKIPDGGVLGDNTQGKFLAAPTENER